ncbi:SDR family NAD(P)-dependent oxidoreductase [Streptomyces anandii]|uniref:SDR family NAD(P)-dependent oxidoreductase n=1 Tax=Streptomyces anandii TaxID=285454 RepID=UPI0036FE0451
MLVNNAGINEYGPFDRTDPALLTKAIEVNVVAPTVLARAAVPGMLARGRGRSSTWPHCWRSPVTCRPALSRTGPFTGAARDTW